MTQSKGKSYPRGLIIRHNHFRIDSAIAKICRKKQQDYRGALWGCNTYWRYYATEDDKIAEIRTALMAISITFPAENGLVHAPDTGTPLHFITSFIHIRCSHTYRDMMNVNRRLDTCKEIITS